MLSLWSCQALLWVQLWKISSIKAFSSYFYFNWKMWNFQLTDILILFTFIVPCLFWSKKMDYGIVYLHLSCLFFRSHDDVIKWKHFPRYWPFVQGIHRSPVNSLHKGQWCGALIFSLICTWINSWVNNREAGDLSRHCDHYDVTVTTSHGHCNTITNNADSFQINSAKQKQSSYELFIHRTGGTPVIILCWPGK